MKPDLGDARDDQEGMLDRVRGGGGDRGRS